MAGLSAAPADEAPAAAGIDLRIEGVSKTFGETRALREVSLSVRPGSVHALVGENGAGKSTLGRIIAGVIEPDSGRILINGQPVQLRSPRDALDRGIATIAQEIALVPALTAAQNVLLGIEPRRLGFVDRAEMTRRYDRLAADAGFDVPADRPVAEMPIGQQQEVEILRALSRNAGLIVMDEPSARLSAGEAAKLRLVVRRLAEGGRSVLLISHFLREVLDVADEVTVLRDGEVVRHARAANESEASLIESMLGRELTAQFPSRRLPAADAPVVLEVTDLSGPEFQDVSLEVRAGEIVGLAGLVGAGRSEVAHAIVGATPVTAGRLRVGTAAGPFRSPRHARANGVLIIPESRREQGLFSLRPTRENASMATIEDMSRVGFIQADRERSRTAGALRGAQVNATGDAPMAALSGGNQQKVLFARAVLAGPALLIADEPTRGVDVGAKRAIYDLLVDLAAQGMAVLLISSEMEEILGLAHRVVVMRAGRVTGRLGSDEISEAAILRAAFESADEEAAA